MTKDEFQAKLNEHMTSLQTELGELQAKASDASDDLKVELNEQIESLKAKFSEAEVKFESLKDATEEAWEELKADAESIFTAVSEKVVTEVTEAKADVEEHISNPTGLFAKIKSMFS